MSRLSQRHTHSLLLVLSCAILAIALGTMVSCQPTRPVNPGMIGPRQVTGTLVLLLSGDSLVANTIASAIELPDIDVRLEDAATQASVSTTKTQLDGKFYLTAPAPGTYRVCWKTEGISGCGNRFEVKNDSVFLKFVGARAEPGLVYGRVLTADNRPCWVTDPFFDLDVATEVHLLDNNQQVMRKVRANISGEYAFGGVKSGNRYTVRANCEKTVEQGLASLGSTPAQTNLTLKNHAPRIAALAAFSGGQGLTRAVAGATIQASAIARDAENDAVEYLWRTVEGSGTVPGVNSAQQDWKLSPAAGRQTLYLMGRDGKGGYSFKRFDMLVGTANVGFSGRVVDEMTQSPIANARVEVGSVATTTNAQGWFNLSVPPMASPERYVMNIRHQQYATLSRIHDKDTYGATYELISSQTTNHDPGQVIDVVDKGSSGPCGSRDTQAKVIRTLHGNVDERYQKPCRHRGAHIIVPAGALVDSAGNPAAGPVKMAFATMNPSRRALPGDYRAVDHNSTPVEMLSFGAIFAEFRDNGGQQVNLRPGSAAEVRVPVSDEQRPVAPLTIPLWSYNETTGLWVEEGQAALQNTAEGWMYIGQAKHFSYINMDVAGTDPAQATCVRLQLGQSLSNWTDLKLRAYVSYAGTSVQVKETDLNTDQYHAIFRIPYAPPAPPPNTLRLELRGTYQGTQVLLLNNIIATDAPRPKMTGTNLWPNYPYTECGDVITLEADPVNLPQYGDIDATGRPAFLTGPGGQFLPANGEQVATDYYNTIDPGNATNPNLQTWWTNHGFNADGSGGSVAPYLNYNDLGFGRYMSCKVTGSDLACYVTNYGLPDQNLANADFAADPANHADKRGATVAMEYKASEPADRRVRFYVYAGGDPATAGKLKFADLDGLGPKPVPHLCIVCHGGSYNNAANNSINARFREFDLPSFKYSGGRSWDYGQNTLNANELTAFAELNKMVRDISPNTSPIKDLINAWYPGNNFSPGTAPVLPTPPSGWSTQVNGYHEVYGKSCRTCHVARDNGVANAYITFNESANFAGTSYVVCGSPKVMPNAFVTYKNFWGDIQRVIAYGNLTGGTCQ